MNKFLALTKIPIAQTLLHFESIDLTESQIKQLFATQILETVLDDVDKTIITNLLNTVDYIEKFDLSSINVDCELYKKLNELFAFEQALSVGEFRNTDVTITCIDYPIKPVNLDTVNNILKNLANINKDNFKEIIADSFMTLSRIQPFYDGNKRTTLFLCNIALAKQNLGYFSIPNEMYAMFEEYLTLFYRDNNKEPLKNLIINEFIFGKN